MKILLVTETLHVGGAETFVVRLANALSAEHEVWVFNLHPELSRAELMASLLPEVRLVNYHQAASRVVNKLDGLLHRLGVDYSVRQNGIVNSMVRLLRQERIDVVHSHLFKTDYYTTQARLRFPGFRHVSTNHGDYLLYASQTPWRTLHYERKLAEVVSKLDAMVNISTEQELQFRKFRQDYGSSLELARILNGYTVGHTRTLTRSDLGIDDDALVFGMVARGIPEKGWEILTTAFIRANLPGSRLLFVGEGPELDRLKTIHGNRKSIVFAGYTDNTAGYIKLFDVGVLPSVYKAESLPTVVIEYLHEGKPVLASDIGELRTMITTEAGDIAGTLVPVGGPESMIEALAAAMLLMHRDPVRRAHLESLSRQAFGKFSMDVCTRKYVSLYSRKAAPEA